MPTIHILPPEVANKIAAGEVVERPASVVRELLDNAIDAGADRITVEVEDGGLVSMRVTDNGCGMSPEDARLCAQRHATSKIQSAEDLENITSKGFRGEALASIASVSKLKLITRRPEDSEATQIQIEGGRAKKTGPAAGPPGTTITVSDLFFNTPARKKFLKRPTTEMGHICSAVTWLALAHEQIHFTLIHNRRTVLELAGVSNRAERIMSLYGRDIINEIVPLSLDTPALSIAGFISRPTTTRNGTQHIFTFVNDRYIRNRIIQRALMDGCRNIFPVKRYPIVFLYINLDPRSIDVNVHPTKQEVKFAREDAVFSAVYGVVRQAWEERGRITTAPDQPESAVTPSRRGDTARPRTWNAKFGTQGKVAPSAFRGDVVQSTKKLLAPQPPPTLPQTLGESRRVSAIEEGRSTERVEIKNGDELEPSKSAVAQPKPLEIPPDLFRVSSVDQAPELRVCGQLANSYILAEGEDGLFIIDQHAAHERILFERFLSKSKRGPLPGQSLLFPLTLDLSPAEMEALTASLKTFQRLGFDLETFGPATYAIRAIPADLSVELAVDLIRDILSEIQNEGSADEKAERALHTLSCRSAVKFGDPLDSGAMQAIIDGLRTVARRDFCPHGRPSVLHLSDEALRRAFRRT